MPASHLVLSSYGLFLAVLGCLDRCACAMPTWTGPRMSSRTCSSTSMQRLAAASGATPRLDRSMPLDKCQHDLSAVLWVLIWILITNKEEVASSWRRGHGNVVTASSTPPHFGWREQWKHWCHEDGRSANHPSRLLLLRPDSSVIGLSAGPRSGRCYAPGTPRGVIATTSSSSLSEGRFRKGGRN